MYVWKQNVTYRYGMCIHITFMLWYSVSDGVPVKWFDCVTFILLIYRCLLRGHGIWVLLCKKLIFGGMGICIGVILESWGQSDYKGIWVFLKKIKETRLDPFLWISSSPWKLIYLIQWTFMNSFAFIWELPF